MIATPMVIQWPRWLRGEPPPPATPQPDPIVEQTLRDLRQAIDHLAAEAQAQNARIETQQALIASQEAQLVQANKLIAALQHSERLMLGDQRAQLTRITMLESELLTERNARIEQATLYGDVLRQLALADERLKKQRDDLTMQGQQIAVLENKRVEAEGAALVWQLRAEAYARQLRAAGIEPTFDAPLAPAPASV